MRIDDFKMAESTAILHKRLEGAKEKRDDEALKRVCQDFESIFLSIMFKEMQKTVPENGFIEKGTGSKIFEDMYLEELSQEVARKDDGLGIGKILYEQFTQGNIIL